MWSAPWWRRAAIAAVAALLAGSAAAFGAGAPAPVYGHTVVLSPVRGTVLVTLPGGRAMRLTGVRSVPVGTLVDVSQGTVRLTAADGGASPAYSGTFSQGEFVVRQSLHGGGVTQIVLRGACTQVAADVPLALVARRPRHHVRRFLNIAADGKFVVVAANGTATEEGPAAWIVDDNCDGTTSVRGTRGHVRAQSSSGLTGAELGPGESDVSLCTRGRFCQNAFSDPSTNLGIFGLVVYRRAARFEACVLRAARVERCDSAPLRQVRSQPRARDNVMSCTYDSLPRGTYRVTFLVNGRQVGKLLPFITHHVPDPAGPNDSCIYN